MIDNSKMIKALCQLSFFTLPILPIFFFSLLFSLIMLESVLEEESSKPLLNLRWWLRW